MMRRNGIWSLSGTSWSNLTIWILKLLFLHFPPLQFPSEGGFPHRLIWRSLAPLKVYFFVWEASHGKILTFGNLLKRRRYGSLLEHLGTSYSKSLWGRWISLERLKDNFIKTLCFWNKGNFCVSALNVGDLVDNLNIGCIQSFVGCFLSVHTFFLLYNTYFPY